MTLENAIRWAVDAGYETAEELELKSGEVVYLLVGGGKIGLPRYIRDVDGFFELSDDAESMALFREPAFLEGDDD